MASLLRAARLPLRRTAVGCCDTTTGCTALATTLSGFGGGRGSSAAPLPLSGRSVGYSSRSSNNSISYSSTSSNNSISYSSRSSSSTTTSSTNNRTSCSSSSIRTSCSSNSRAVDIPRGLAFPTSTRSCNSFSSSTTSSPPPPRHDDDEGGVSDVLQRATSLSEEVLGGNWADYFWLVQNSDFWLAELQRVEEAAIPHSEVPEVKQKMNFLRRLFDVLCIVEDVKDHLSEVMEQASRSSGIAGIGLNAGPAVTNVDEHANAASKVYDELLEKYPEFSFQIENVVGAALATLRQKHKFNFSSMHRFFF